LSLLPKRYSSNSPTATESINPGSKIPHILNDRHNCKTTPIVIKMPAGTRIPALDLLPEKNTECRDRPGRIKNTAGQNFRKIKPILK